MSSTLILSLFPLSEILKYGNVRRSDKGKVNTIATTIFYRTLVGVANGKRRNQRRTGKKELADQIKTAPSGFGFE